MATEEIKEFALDESAQQLYEQLAGIDDTLRVDSNLRLESELMRFLQQEEKKRDQFRLLIAQAAGLFVEILTETKNPEFDTEQHPKARILRGVLGKLGTCAGRDTHISCRFRGQQTVREAGSASIANPEALDYELSIGDTLLDYLVAQKVAEREPSKALALGVNLLRTFRALSGLQIYNFTIEVKTGSEAENFNRIERALRSLIRYYKTHDTDDRYFVRDEYGLPNLNLTVLASTNKVRPDSLQQLVDRIKPRLLGPDPAPELSRFTTAYDVILATKRYHRQLPKAAIEVNSVHQLMLNSRPNRKRTAEAIQVSRLILAKYGSDPRKVSELISSISEEGYSNVQSKVMGQRLSQATEFLDLAESCENREKLQQEALQNIEEGLQLIPDEVYDELSIEGDRLSARDQQGVKTSWALHRKVFQLVSYFKQRAMTKRKVREINTGIVEFNALDYSVIATNCKVSVEQAQHLIDLLKECFTKTGRFRRTSFEKHIPEFLRYEENVFEFLWYYLKELRLKEDRIAFLNAIQLLVGQLQNPGKALNILLTDIFNPTSLGRFSDRNGLILATILLRTYNQEASSQIELTPEEVLYVKKGLNAEMVGVALEFFRYNQEQVVLKVKRLTELLLQFSVKKAHQEEQMELRFLLSLMRELVVFCALIGGRISQSTVRGVVREFGNPESPFYRKIGDKEEISRGLKLLQVAARGLKRFDEPHFFDLLRSIAHREQEFIKLYDNPTHRTIVKKIMDQISRPTRS